jgi:hypothetical protein
VETYSVPHLDYVVIAGGGAGVYSTYLNNNSRAAGGGAGGFITGSANLVPFVSYPVTVGAGGLKNQSQPTVFESYLGTNGQTSSFVGITALGGGFGGFYVGAPFNYNLYGAKSVDYTDIVGSGGGNFGSGSLEQGNNGGQILGGGAASGGDFGDGKQWLNGVYYAGGGGGFGVNGLGGFINVNNGIGANNAGGGGKGGYQLPAVQNGQSGSVILRYKGDEARAAGGTITSASGYIYHTFSNNDLFVVAPSFNYTLIGGGGGGSRGIRLGAGAGGAGGTIYKSGLHAAEGEVFNVTIGAGGIGEWNRGETPLNDAENGGATILTALSNDVPFIVSASGGTAGTKPFESGASLFNGGDGGDSGNIKLSIDGALTNTPYYYIGGAGNSNTNNAIAAGGGGASAGFNGGPATIDTFRNVGKAGAGATSSLAGYAGGGGGGAVYSVNSAPGGGNDGGGNGGWINTILVGSDATPNTGAGGGGGSQSQLNSVSYYGGNGGSGIAFLSYNGTGSKATGGTISYNASTDTTLHTFTASGIFTWTN